MHSHDQKINSLYNALFAKESKHRPLQYPIHKKLVFPKQQTADIYDWVLQNLPLPNAGNILDAGCGVGFGSVLLASRLTCNIEGMTLSEQEYQRAISVLRSSSYANLSYSLQSFDALQADQYDGMLYIESLKHSGNLNKSMQAMATGLKPHSKAFIIEDIFVAGVDAPWAEELIEDWHIKAMYTYADIQQAGLRNGLSISIKDDLTALMPAQNALFTSFKLFLLNMLAEVWHSDVIKAFRGGAILDKLYQQQHMRYLVLEAAHIGPKKIRQSP